MQDTRQIILDSAIRLFANRGYAGTSVDEILRGTSLSKPTLYYHFHSKAGLFRAILDFAYDEAFRRIQQAVARQTGCRQRLVDLAAAFFRFANEHQSLMRLVFSSIFAGSEEIPSSCIDPDKRRRNFELLVQVVREGQLAGELDSARPAEQLAHGIYGAISHQTRMHLLCPNGPLDRSLAEHTVDLFLDGARAPCPSPNPVPPQ